MIVAVWGIHTLAPAATAGVTYMRLLADWPYRVAVLDWYSRYVLAWELCDTLE